MILTRQNCIDSIERKDKCIAELEQECKIRAELQAERDRFLDQLQINIDLESRLAEAQWDAERLAWAKSNPLQFYEICQDTLMSCVNEDVAIDAAIEDAKSGT